MQIESQSPRDVRPKKARRESTGDLRHDFGRRQIWSLIEEAKRYYPR